MKVKLKWLPTQANAGEVIDKSHWGDGEENLYTCAREPMASDFPGFPDWKRTTSQDLLLTRNGTPYVHSPIAGSIYSNVVQRITVPHQHREYLRYALYAELAQFRGYGVSIESLNYTMWGNLTISLPDLPTQKTIAAFLDRETARIDQLIDKKQRLVELLGERVASSAFHYTGGIPAGLWGCEYSSAALPELPTDWDTRKLSSLCGFVQGKAHEPYFDPEGEFVCATARFVSSGIPNRYCTQNLTPAKPSDILMVMSDLPNGRALARAYLVKADDKIAVNQRVCALTVREGDPRYFAYQLNRNRQLLRYNDGNNQTHLSNRAFKSLTLIVPPVEVQRRIADQLDEIVETSQCVVERTRTSIDRLKEYRSALITAAVTGQIDVETWSRRGEGDRRLDRIEEEMAG